MIHTIFGQKCVGRGNDIRKRGKVNTGSIGADIILDIKTIARMSGDMSKSKPE